MPQKMYPFPGNQWWILRNMARNNSKTNKKYLPESETTAKWHLNQQKQRPVEEASTNVTPIKTKSGEITNEILLQVFDPT